MTNPPVKKVIASMFNNLEYDPYKNQETRERDLPEKFPTFDEIPDEASVSVIGVKQLMFCMHTSTERAFLDPSGIDTSEDLEKAVMDFVNKIPALEPVVKPFFDKSIKFTPDIPDWNGWYVSLKDKPIQLEFISMVRHLNQKIAIDYIIAFLTLYLHSIGVKNAKDLYRHYQYVRGYLPMTCKSDDITNESYVYFMRHCDLGPQKVIIEQLVC